MQHFKKAKEEGRIDYFSRAEPDKYVMYEVMYEVVVQGSLLQFSQPLVGPLLVLLSQS